MMKCENCKADNKMKSICDAGITCYMLRCGEYGCALNSKTVNKLLRMKKEEPYCMVEFPTKEDFDFFNAAVNFYREHLTKAEEV